MTMSNREYSALVDAGAFPDSVEVPIDPPFINENGAILNLLTERFTHAAILTSRPGAVRANHYHKTDWHYAYVIDGEVEYFHRPVGSGDAPTRERFPRGTMFFSPPLVEHAMFFPVPTTIITFARNARSEHDTHEQDLVRVKLIEAVWSPCEGRFFATIVA